MLQLYDASKKKVIGTGLAATDFVMGEGATSACGDVQLTALRVPEVDQADADLNGDGDTLDLVMAVHDAVSGVTRVIDYKLLNGTPGSSALWQMLQHVVNHGSYHRGQVTTMIRQLGGTPAKSLDMIAFYRERTAKT